MKHHSTDGRDDPESRDEAVEQQLTEPLGVERPVPRLISACRLKVLAGPDLGAEHALSEERTVIGTHRSADFVLTDPTLSRFHCEITVAEGWARIVDLDSLNGTRVDGVRVEAARLDRQATFTLGQTVLSFTVRDERIAVPVSERRSFGTLIGESAAMRAVFARLERAAASDVTVLLQGETGTGKELAAESIHAESSRRGGPFVVVDCGAIPDGLLESELFGHERGAFTGAEATRAGAFERASGGTLFLDEIGELSLTLQPKLLRVLERREIQRVGGSRRIAVDVRLVAATNRNLRTEVNARRFRSDLYYRTAVLVVTLPPLRERPEDIAPLVERMLAAIGAGEAAAARLLSGEVLSELARHLWPGNVRELRNYLERCMAQEHPEAPVPSDDGEIDVSQPLRVAREQCVRRFEQQYLERLMRRHRNNVTAAARAAGVERVHLHRLLARAGFRR